MKVYISGAITGLPKDDAKETFRYAQEYLEEQGYEVENPMSVSIDTWSWEDYMRHDIKRLMDCDAICMLWNWQQSKGAKIEHSLAIAVGMKVMHLGVLKRKK